MQSQRQKCIVLQNYNCTFELLSFQNRLPWWGRGVGVQFHKGRDHLPSLRVTLTTATRFANEAEGSVSQWDASFSVLLTLWSSLSPEKLVRSVCGIKDLL